ncbi:MAG: hypothetical protein F6K28_52750, partial [Microcoleus sp. SIO2G3]|nr:hypothetical protein [Microcoleus sp. SIO2G3]
ISKSASNKSLEKFNRRKICKNNKYTDNGLHLQIVYHCLQCSFNSEEIQEAEIYFGELVSGEINFAYNYADFRYYTGLVLQHFGKHYSGQFEIIAKSRENFQAAIIIFNQIGDTERSEKVQRIMKNGADI